MKSLKILIHHYSVENIEFLVDKFNNQSFLKSEWTHETHLVVGIYFLKNYNFYEAVCRLKSGIILLNKSHQTSNTSDGGYHETLTIFWAKIIRTYLELRQANSIEILVNTFLNSSLADKELAFKFYDKKRLLSPHYRTFYIKENRLAIDKVTIMMLLNKK